MPLLSPPGFFPLLTDETQALLRVTAGALMLGTLLLALPHWRRFFLSERWGGYAKSAPDVDALHNPLASALVAALWLGSAVLLTLGVWSAWAALANLLLCRYFFVRMRWKGVLRGMGAPGFMSYWLGAVVFLLEFTRAYAPELRPLALLVSQVDFAFIMLSAGLYKSQAGYAQNDGMEGGMVNPQWGYWWWLYKRLPPRHLLFRFLNHTAWGFEVLGGVLMLVPQTRFLGGMVILASFVFIATHIRLALLCEVVIVCCFIFFHPGSPGDWVAAAVVPASLAAPTNPALALPSALHSALALFLWAYLVLLPLAHAGLFLNFFGKRALPGPLQRALELYTNFFGIIIWRVFSADHTNFFVEVYSRPRAGGPRRLVSRRGLSLSPAAWRYNHVAESIVLTTLFTTLKYYPSNDALFRERVLRYARTVERPEGDLLEFEYIRIAKREREFEFVPVALYTVDVESAEVVERALDEGFSVRATLPVSPVHEGARPGSYVPLKG